MLPKSEQPPADEPGQPDPAATDEPVAPIAVPLRWVRVSHHTPDHIATRYPYAAYGSNLSLSQIVRRCPSADIKGQGTLRNAKLVFAYYLGIAESEGSSVPVAVYTMTAADVAAMDRHEGLGRGTFTGTGQYGYERYLVTVEINGEAVRCFTYVKRDNELEEPSEGYYQTCLAGYADWNFDTRRLRHARDDARKNGKRRTYSPAYGYWTGEQTHFDWDAWRKGTAYTDGKGRSSPPQRGARNSAFIPSVKSYDNAVGQDEPEGNGTAASYNPRGLGPQAIPEPRISLVTGRERPSARRARENAVATFKRTYGSGNAGPVDPTRISTLNGEGQEEFSNDRTGERWRKGANGVWYRVKE